MKFYAVAPSNIAWIKYMGKTDAVVNLPENPSLSLTLNHLATHLTLETDTALGAPHLYALARPVNAAEWFAPQFTPTVATKFFRHADRTRTELRSHFEKWGIEFHDRLATKDFVIASANTFPAGSGIASSASSFAALTLAVAAACAREPESFFARLESPVHGPEIRGVLAGISRQGSGSSCRSFMGPFVRWDADQVFAICADRLGDLAHFVLLVTSAEKTVSSSEAHRRVKTSPQWSGRPARATERLARVLDILSTGDRTAIAREVWEEFMDMHGLFHSAQPPFSYWLPRTEEALRAVEGFKLSDGQPPIITMDAGANLHFTVPRAQAAEVRAFLAEKFPDLGVLADEIRVGAQHGARVRIER